MKLHELHPAEGSTAAQKRLGRGSGSGLGKTSGKGHKGAKARSGGGKRPGFEGGQMPLYRRLPKRGFKHVGKAQIETISLSDLDKFEDGADVTIEALLEEGIIRDVKDGVKVLANGELTRKVNVAVNAYSAGAKAKIEELGGKAEVI